MSSLEPKIKRNVLAGAFLRLFGLQYWGVNLDEFGITLCAKRRRYVPFSEIATPISLTKTFGLSTISFLLRGNNEIKVVGVKHYEAVSFISTVNVAWQRHFLEQFKSAEREIESLSEVVERLGNPRRYPAACLLSPYLERISQTLRALPPTIPEGILSGTQERMLSNVLAFHRKPENMRDDAVKAFIETELGRMKEFFDAIETNPLTPEQRLAVVTDEDATLVLAGAGSGKTSVIVAKASYLIKQGIRNPSEVLLMAFGKDAAAEMANRIKERSGAAVEALTFHALGYKIIREVEGGAPALAAHASDDAQFQAFLRDILIKDVIPQVGLGALLMKWFSEFNSPYKSRWDFKTQDEYYQYMQAHEFRTLQGERVKSFEEWEIANWLYLNGIAYKYEPDYEHALPENDRRTYTPDFWLTKSGVYIEHFGVRKSHEAEGSPCFITAPYVDRKKYLEDMAWKQKVHKDHGTILIETYSYERDEGRLTEALHEKLAPYVDFNPIPQDLVFNKLSKMGQIDSFTQTLGTFLRHFKGSGSSIDKCRANIEGAVDAPRNRAFLKIFEALLEIYQKRLDGRIDFEDMIARAAEHVEAGRYQSPYHHLLVDEFQDISDGRARLLKALKAQHRDARIFAVGDDWQSIYRFAGSDIHLMRDFGAEFGGGFADVQGINSMVDLGRTFRSVDKIALPARHFILQNPSQIEKAVIPAGTVYESAIKVIYYDRGNDEATLRTALDQISSSIIGHTSVLLLGRYHFVKPVNGDRLGSNYPKLSIRFMTVHASKGLEADHVVIMRATLGQMGFPAEVVDDPLLDLVLPKPEKFNHAEERRLFYVALTRARKSVTILTDREKPSTFVRELLDNDEYGVVEIGARGITERRCGVCGGRMIAQERKNGSVIFSCEHDYLCGHELKPCNVCKKDLPAKDPENPWMMTCSCGAKFQACPDCSDGWLVERKGRYGDFLGCVRYPECPGKQKMNQEPTGFK